MGSPYDPYLTQAEALFQAGDVVKAGQIWQAILKKDPTCQAARSGLYRVKAHFDARATQDGLEAPPLPGAPVPGAPRPGAPEPGAPDRQTHTPPPTEVNSLLEAGCALYDAGKPERAIATWELALKQDPENALARGYIDGARRELELRAAPPEAPAEAPDADRLVRDGCTLYDMGQTEDALAKWERALEADPGNALVRTYINGARRDLGLPPLAGAAEGPSASPAPEAGSRTGADEAERLVREGIQIYELGMADEAIEKWRRALDADPGQPDAQAYLDMAMRERGTGPTPTLPAVPAPPEPAHPVAEPGEDRILAAERLLRTRRIEEAAYSFQQLLEAGSRDPRVILGYQQCRTLLGAQAAPEAPPAHPVASPEPAPVEAAPVPAMPRTVTTRATTRGGPRPPRVARDLPVPEWLLTPRNVTIAGLAVVVLLTLSIIFRSYQRDVALREAVAAARNSAAAPAARKTQAPVLGETPAAIRAEADKAVSDDPLTAYYRAQECLRLDPGDAAAAQILDRAKAGLAALPPLPESPDLDKSLRDGDLDTARSTLLNRLRQAPDDAELKGRAKTVWLALVQARAGAEHYGDARDLLLQGRAMFPQDRTWLARLRLLEQIQALPKGQRAPWIPLLG
ncbi:tetratricopeptide repeat protein [Mesoterricola sediminis]|uniref:Tetratricopeptide repeat protein n=1 Tax=Mesoterricola sediminis TaxID=2927980 RepID=A0AA48GWA4_9BACT|nr:tetratricopeptide repeat protein [Mesoterricola sediminis]BDU78792.1 hypothetical protein METESE_37500 [Mesoterricola sediminis]